MAAKTKTTTPKTSAKTAKATAVTKGVKAKKPAAKASKKAAPKKKAEKQPEITLAQFEKWFHEQPSNIFVQLTEGWNEKNLKIKLKKQADYDGWLDYFKSLPPSTIRLLARTGQDILPTEGYAALARWHDIISNPARIDKIYQAGLRSKSKNDKDGIVAMALKNDRYGVLKATRDKLAEKLDKGAGSRDTAALARELTEVMTQIADYEKRLGPKKTTKLGELLADMPTRTAGKRTRSKGARNTSFASRVTIEDVEG